MLLLADQLISHIKYIHAKSLIYRDIKLNNFLMGIGKRGNQVNIINFNLTKKYCDSKIHFYVLYHKNKSLINTICYASINNYLRVKQSQRDDIESLKYIILYFCRKSLPWQRLRVAGKKEKYNKILEKKRKTLIKNLYYNFLNKFLIYLNYTQSLYFNDKPDYSYLYKIFRDLFIHEAFQYDYVFNWTIYKY